jgi:hypothetical protein
MKAMLKPPGPKHLKLKCDLLLSTFAFNLNSRRYTTDTPVVITGHVDSAAAGWAGTEEWRDLRVLAAVGPGRCFPPRHPTNCEISSLELNGIV